VRLCDGFCPSKHEDGKALTFSRVSSDVLTFTAATSGSVLARLYGVSIAIGIVKRRNTLHTATVASVPDTPSTCLSVVIMENSFFVWKPGVEKRGDRGKMGDADDFVYYNPTAGLAVGGGEEESPEEMSEAASAGLRGGLLWYWGFFRYKKRLFSIQDIIIYHYISRCYHCVSLCIIVDITIYHVPRRHMISMISMIHNARHDIP
jgi:hypothetical protein